jgi:cytochrome P450
MAHIYERYDQMRSNGPIIARPGYQGMALYVIGHHEAKEILGDHRRFVKDFRNTLPPEERPQAQASNDMFGLLYDNMLNKDRPDHTRLRALVSKAFTNRQIQALAPRIQENADQLIVEFEAKGEVDLIEVYAFPLPIIVICELLGVPIEDRGKFRKWSHAFIGIADDELSYVNSLTDFVQYIGRMIAERRDNPTGDLISGLVHAEEDGERPSFAVDL